MRKALLVVALLVGAGAQAEKKLDLRKTELYLKTLEGADTKLAPFAGSKVTLVNLWATWCGPCREELPALDKLHNKYKAKGFRVVGLDVDEPVDAVKKFLAKQKITYPILLSTPDKTVPSLGNLEGLPTSLLLDETGDVLEVLVGGIEIPYVESAIKKQLAKK
jgi:thiol-disulfide isomerase/thioredoxin